jgi:hypothetical protein
MPHLQFETNTALDPTDRRALTEWATERYGEVMETGTGHVAVTVRTVDTLTLGRAGRPNSASSTRRKPSSDSQPSGFRPSTATSSTPNTRVRSSYLIQGESPAL